MKFKIVCLLLLFTVLCSGCREANNPFNQESVATTGNDSLSNGVDQETTHQAPTLVASAEESTKRFYKHLNEGEYDQAVDLYGGSYDILQSYNPDLDHEDYAALLQAGCEFNGLMCLEVLNVVSIQTSDEHEFFFEIEFANPDGSLFVRGPCCGETEEDMPSQSSFMIRVVCQDDGSCLVMDLPPYVP